MSNRTASARVTALRSLVRAPYPKEQSALREALQAGGNYLGDMAAAYVRNPFLRLTDEEAETLGARAQPQAFGGLLAARHRAMAPGGGPRHAVFCMPKSGSSFVQTALQHALELPLVSLTSFGAADLSSAYGMNGREQEIDELAVVKAAILSPQGFVAQAHTRYTPYLGLQMGAFRLRPIVTLRNILDALVSYDDMMLAWRAGKGPEGWFNDGPFALPRGYPELAPEQRYTIIAHSLGVWLIQFHLSWKRCLRQRYASPLVIRYEEDVLDPPRLIARLAEWAELTERQKARLSDFVATPDRERSRFNVGKAGRGRERIPGTVRDFLIGYARNFADEIPDEDIAYLLD